ncbi:MAG: peptidylprolyl isomerase [Phycisphaerae bacterium]
MTGLACSTILWFAILVPGQSPNDSAESPAVERPLAERISVMLRVDKTTLPVGSPVVVEFVVNNRTGEPVTLDVPGALKGKTQTDYGMGLPLEHVFSGVNFRGLEVASEQNPRMGDRVMRKPEFPVPAIVVAPYATVGLRFDVARFYPGLHQSGTFVLQWKPYGGAVATKPVTVKVVPYKQAIIETTLGNMTMRFFYDKAPRHVENFIELAERRFYNGKTFHVIYPNQFILGGCPVGDGTGKRDDGVTLEPEFNDTPFDFGTVGMALIDGDPHSASCQFFICLARQAGWDGHYTAFGRIQGPESLATLRKLGALTGDEQHRPLKPVKIKTISIVDMPYVPRTME